VCLLIDASVLGGLFVPSPPTEFAPLLRWLWSDEGRCVLGGRLRVEWTRVEAARAAAVELDRAGRLWRADEAVVEKETQWAAGHPALRSNDPHVIGLGRATGARVLATADAALMADWKDPKLLPVPRGKVYREAASVSALGHSRNCPFTAGRKGRR
jgi:hypothetical protein